MTGEARPLVALGTLDEQARGALDGALLPPSCRLTAARR